MEIPTKSFHISAAGHHLFCETYGLPENPPVVLLHHGLGSLESWREQVSPLVEAGYFVVVYDRWGYGRSDPRNEPIESTFRIDREDLRALLFGLSLERVSLVGHSDGGTLALYHAGDYPGQVASLVVVAAHVYVEPRMKTGIEGIRSVYESQPRFREGLSRLHGDLVDSVFDNWYEGWLREENLSWDIRPRLARIACPALVVQGLEDEHALPQHARDIAAAIPHAELWLAESADHMLPQNEPQAFNRRLLTFLEKVAVDD